MSSGVDDGKNSKDASSGVDFFFYINNYRSRFYQLNSTRFLSLGSFFSSLPRELFFTAVCHDSRLLRKLPSRATRAAKKGKEKSWSTILSRLR